MIMTRKALCWLGAMSLGAGLCASAQAQHRLVGNRKVDEQYSEIGTPADVVEVRAPGHSCLNTAHTSTGAMGYGGGDGCYHTGCDDGRESCAPRCPYGRGYVAYEAVYVQPHFSRDAAFYVSDDGTAIDRFIEVPFDWDFEWGHRVEIGYINCHTLGARVRYFRFDHSASLSGTAPTGGGLEASFTGSDDAAEIEIEDADSITASHSLELDVLDLEFTKLACDTLFSAGLRYVRMDQDYRADSIGSGEDDIISGHHDFEGFGLTAAVEYSHLAFGRLSGFIRARGSLLYGESNFLATDGTATDFLLRSNDHDLINILELQIGLDWRACTQCGSIFYFSVALEAQHWSNAGTALPGRVGNDDGNYLDAGVQEADLGLFGFTVGVGYIF